MNVLRVRDENVLRVRDENLLLRSNLTLCFPHESLLVMLFRPCLKNLCPLQV